MITIPQGKQYIFFFWSFGQSFCQPLFQKKKGWHFFWKNIWYLKIRYIYLQKIKLTNQNKITPVKSLLDLRKEFNREIEHFLSKNRFSTNLTLYSKDLDYDGTRARYKAVFINRYTKEHIILIKEYHA